MNERKKKEVSKRKLKSVKSKLICEWIEHFAMIACWPIHSKTEFESTWAAHTTTILSANIQLRTVFFFLAQMIRFGMFVCCWFFCCFFFLRLHTVFHLHLPLFSFFLIALLDQPPHDCIANYLNSYTFLRCPCQYQWMDELHVPI